MILWDFDTWYQLEIFSFFHLAREYVWCHYDKTNQYVRDTNKRYMALVWDQLLMEIVLVFSSGQWNLMAREMTIARSVSCEHFPPERERRG